MFYYRMMDHLLYNKHSVSVKVLTLDGYLEAPDRAEVLVGLCLWTKLFVSN